MAGPMNCGAGLAAHQGSTHPMNRKRRNSQHRLGVGIATVVVLGGLLIIILDLARGARSMEILGVSLYTFALAAIVYVIVRVIGLVFGDRLASTDEHRMPRS